MVQLLPVLAPPQPIGKAGVAHEPADVERVVLIISLLAGFGRPFDLAAIVGSVVVVVVVATATTVATTVSAATATTAAATTTAATTLISGIGPGLTARIDCGPTTLLVHIPAPFGHFAEGHVLPLARAILEAPLKLGVLGIEPTYLKHYLEHCGEGTSGKAKAFEGVAQTAFVGQWGGVVLVKTFEEGKDLPRQGKGGFIGKGFLQICKLGETLFVVL